MYTILYVDDEPDMLVLGKESLELTGDFSIDTALSAYDGLLLLDKKSYDAVISDFQMPRMDGIAFLKEIRGRYRDIPFILFTGKGREEVVIEALNAGADFYLQKGGNPEAQFAELAHKVRQAVRGRQAEQARAISEEKFSKVFFASPSVGAITDYLTGTLSEVNDNFVRTTGYSRAELIGRTTRDLNIFVDYSDREKMGYLLKTEGSLQDFEAKIRTKSGETRTLLFSGERIRIADQDLLFFQAIDITDRKSAETALRKNQILLANAMNLSHLVNWEFDVASGIFTFNDRFYALYGTTAEREGGYQMSAETYAGTFVHPDDAYLVGEEIRKVLDITDPMYSSQLDHRIIRRDGEIRYITVRIAVILGQSGNVVRTYGANQDITDRIRAEKALKESEEKFRALVDNAFDAILILDPAGTLLFANPAAGLLVGTENVREMIGHTNVLEFIAPESRADVLRDFGQVAQGIDGYLATYKIRTSTGTDVWVESVGKIIRFGGNRAILISLRNITEEYRAKASLRESEEKFRTIFNGSPLPISITGIPDNKFLAVNAAFLEKGGYTEEEVLGRSPVELGLLSHEDYQRLVTQSLSRDRIESVPLTLTREERDPIHVLFTTTPILINDKPVLLTMTVDVTPGKKAEEDLRRKTEELHAAYEQLTSAEEELRQNYNELSNNEQALRASEEKFRALVEYSLEGILITDFSGNLLFANQAAGRIVEAADYRTLIGHTNVLEFIAPESRTDVLRDFSQVAQGTDAYQVQYKLITEKKREIWVECIGKKIPFQESSAILVSMRDITGRKLAEVALRESENKFATVFRRSPIALTLASATDGKFIDVNDAFVKNTGYSREESIGKTSEELGLFADSEERKRMVASLRTEQAIYGREIHFRVKTGRIRVCLFSSGLIRMNGRPHILSTIEDITERKTTEFAFQAMVRSMVGTTGQSSLRKITETISSWLETDCVMIGEIQPDKNTVKVLSMVLDGKEVPDFSYTLAGTPCEDVAEKGFCLYPDNVRELFPESKDLADLNIRGYMGTPLRNSEGQVFGILCVLSRSPLQPSQMVQEILDVIAVKAAAEVERTQIERALRASEEKFRTLVEHSMDGILILDMNGMILFGNRAVGKIIGTQTSTDLAVGTTNVLDYIASGSKAKAVQDLDQVARGIDSYLVNYQVVTATGTDTWVECIGKRIIFRNSPAILVSLRDISTRKHMEDAILSANKQLNLLSSITRHDVLNKISVIQGYLALSAKRGPDQDYPAILKKIESATSTIKSQIEFTRIYQSLGAKEPGWQNPAGILSAIHFPDSVVLTNELDSVEIYADLMLKKVFENLVDNSLRHGGNVTGIRIHSRTTPEGLIIFYEDNGIGIPEEDKEDIFERGFGKNTGLGLFLVREILGITGITIRETGENGKGARFEIRVPNGEYRTGSG